MLQITEGITANIFQMINSLAVEAVESGREHITGAGATGLVWPCVAFAPGAEAGPGGVT